MLPKVKIKKKYSLLITFEVLTVTKKRTKTKLTLPTRKREGGSRIELKCFIIYGGQSKDNNTDKSRNTSATYFL